MTAVRTGRVKTEKMKRNEDDLLLGHTVKTEGRKCHKDQGQSSRSQGMKENLGTPLPQHLTIHSNHTKRAINPDTHAGTHKHIHITLRARIQEQDGCGRLSAGPYNGP